MNMETTQYKKYIMLISCPCLLTWTSSVAFIFSYVFTKPLEHLNTRRREAKIKWMTWLPLISHYTFIWAECSGLYIRCSCSYYWVCCESRKVWPFRDKLLNNGGNNRQLGENVPTLPPSNSTWCGQDNDGIIGTEEILLPTATTAGVPPKLSYNSNRTDLLSPAKFQNWRRYFSTTPSHCDWEWEGWWQACHKVCSLFMACFCTFK